MNLIEGIQSECSRLRNDIIPMYEKIGAPGKFGVMMMNGAIKRGEQAIAGGDVVEMMRAYQDLKRFEA